MDIVVGCGVNISLKMILPRKSFLGAVAPTPLLIKEASDIMIGSSLMMTL